MNFSSTYSNRLAAASAMLPLATERLSLVEQVYFLSSLSSTVGGQYAGVYQAWENAGHPGLDISASADREQLPSLTLQANAFSADISNVGHKILLGLEYPEKWVAKAISVTATAIEEEPELKTVVQNVARDGVLIAAQVAKVVAAQGRNLADDAGLLGEIQNFFLGDIGGQLVPIVEKLYGEVKVDLSSGSAKPAAAVANKATS